MDKDETTNKKSSLVEPAQEPVAFMDKSRYFLELDLEDLCVMARCKKHEAVPLYTHPAPAWVGLSDEEIGRLTVFEGLHHVETPLLAKFIIAIEQALKEKNEK